MIHVGRRSYPYMEETNEGLVREFRRAALASGARSRMLDVGCGRGQLGEAARMLGWEVWGIENDDEARLTAAARLDRLIDADLNDHEAVRRAVGNTSFDALVFSDVLEHVYDPRTVLEHYLELANPGALVFISVPNAVAWTNRVQFLFGRFQYDDTGIMDPNTHSLLHVRDCEGTRRSLRMCCRANLVDASPRSRRAAPREGGLQRPRRRCLGPARARGIRRVPRLYAIGLSGGARGCGGMARTLGVSHHHCRPESRPAGVLRAGHQTLAPAEPHLVGSADNERLRHEAQRDRAAVRQAHAVGAASTRRDFVATTSTPSCPFRLGRFGREFAPPRPFPRWQDR